MRFSPEFIERVRDANNIVDVFSEYTPLKRSGGRLMGLCPFPGHNEKTPSFSVSEDKQVYYCFGCKRSGQIFTALQELKGLNFPEAVEYLAKKAGLPIPTESKTSQVQSGAKIRREKLLKINQVAKARYHEAFIKLPSDHPARLYANKRGLCDEIVHLFSIGYAPSQKDALSRELARLKAPLDLAESLGIIKRDHNGDGHYDMFRDRLMFPVVSHKGECVGFGGRALADNQPAKYLNSSESEIFKKGETFYGLHETAKFIRTENYAIVVEGYMDFIALFSAGIKNVVATLGTALTDSHAKLLHRYTQNVVVLYDGDEAGKNGAERSLPILLRHGLFPKAVFLPDELDPDEFIKDRGATELANHLHAAPDLFSIVLERKLVHYRGGASEKVTLLNDLTPILQNIENPSLKDLYIQEIAQKIGVEASWITKHGNAQERPLDLKMAPKAQNQPQITRPEAPDVLQKEPKIKLNGAPRAELFLLNLSLMDRETFEKVAEAQVIDKLSHTGIQELFLKANTFYRQTPNGFDRLLAYLMTIAQPAQALGVHLGEPLCSMDHEGRTQLLEDCIRQIRSKFLQFRSRQLAASLTEAPSEERKRKLEQIMYMQKSKHQLRDDRES